MKLVSCNSNNSLAESIAKKLKKPLCKCVIKRFADMEIFVEILENVRGEDVHVKNRQFLKITKKMNIYA